MKTYKILLILIGVILSAYYVAGQDDIYFFPSKQKTAPTATPKDKDEMTPYEKYRAMKEGEQKDVETSTAFSEQENDKPSYFLVNKDSVSAQQVVVNNYYFDDDRFAFYRRFYLDYYYSPYFYDPIYWDALFWWGYPYVGFYYRYSWPYVWGYYPHYYPYYWGYWDGFYTGYYWRDYLDNQPTGIIYANPGRRMGGYINLSRQQSTSYYSGRFASNDYYHGSRRNGAPTVSNNEMNASNQTLSTRRHVASYKTNNNFVTTRPYKEINSRRNTYIPTYVTPSGERRSYNTLTRNENNYIVVNNQRIKIVENVQNETNNPRRSNVTYTPTVRSTNSYNNSYEPAKGTSNTRNTYSSPSYQASPNNGNNNSGSSQPSSGGSGRRR